MSNTIESIEQGNKLIAEFMGAEFDMGQIHVTDSYTKPDGEKVFKYQRGTAYYLEDMNPENLGYSKSYPMTYIKYHTSWDWLMPVVEKIETLVIKTNITSNCVIIRVNKDELNTDDVVVSYKGIISKIEAVWQAAVQFIEWYNNQKSNQ